jgi:ribosomal protein S18 acetylase RimI-like enzyme
MIARRATPADVAELVRVINHAYEVEADMFIDKRTNEADVNERLARPNATFLVIDGGTPGRLAAGVYVEHEGDRGYFGMLAVDPAHQGQGLGRKLVKAAEVYCADLGCRALDIEVVHLRTELPGFYQSLGFNTVGQTPYPEAARTKQPVELIHMTKSL